MSLLGHSTDPLRIHSSNSISSMAAEMLIAHDRTHTQLLLYGNPVVATY